ncbi:MAG TPA: hypothetical protein VMG12_06420, partial [Polyangiaceae bacterium]|nr:hypothetical protein [Polyangiaceae bacterium]
MQKAWLWGVVCVLACGDDDPPDLIRGTLSCAHSEPTAPGRRFEYVLNRLYDDSVLAVVSCGVNGGRGAATRLFAASELTGAEDELQLDCEVVDGSATPVTPYEFLFTPNLGDHTLRVTVN